MGESFRKGRVVPAQAGTQRRSSKDTGFPLEYPERSRGTGTTALRVVATHAIAMLDNPLREAALRCRMRGS